MKKGGRSRQGQWRLQSYQGRYWRTRQRRQDGREECQEPMTWGWCWWRMGSCGVGGRGNDGGGDGRGGGGREGAWCRTG